MKIYTYYEDVEFNYQTELIDIWRKSWSRQGFVPVVLTRVDAQKSPLYEEYYSFIQRIHKNVSNKILPENSYCLAAQLEIAAFTTIEKQEPSYISDYDLINKDFQFKPKEGKLHWRDECCSCFASSNGNNWIKYIKFLLTQENIITDWCLKEKLKTKKEYFHDQDFLIAIKDQGLEQNVFKMSRQPNLCKMYFPAINSKNIKTYHISHNNIKEIIAIHKKYNNTLNINSTDIIYDDLDKIRLNIAKEILSIQHDKTTQ